MSKTKTSAAKPQDAPRQEDPAAVVAAAAGDPPSPPPPPEPAPDEVVVTVDAAAPSHEQPAAVVAAAAGDPPSPPPPPEPPADEVVVTVDAAAPSQEETVAEVAAFIDDWHGDIPAEAAAGSYSPTVRDRWHERSFAATPDGMVFARGWSFGFQKGRFIGASTADHVPAFFVQVERVVTIPQP